MPKETARITSDADSAKSSLLRVPRQSRGQARVDAILDAAAAAVSEAGTAGVTMHDLAKRSRTSIGSLYHFFADRQSVFHALAARHQNAMNDINRQLDAIPASIWQSLSSCEVIERLLAPYVEYVSRHADCLPLMYSQLSIEDDGGFILTIRRVLDIRLPNVSSEQRQIWAAMLNAIATGTTQVAYQTDPAQASIYHQEVPRVLTLYLRDIEDAARREPL